MNNKRQVLAVGDRHTLVTDRKKRRAITSEDENEDSNTKRQEGSEHDRTWEESKMHTQQVQALRQ